jgi:hypothetical protein
LARLLWDGVVAGVEVRYLELVDISPPGRGDEIVPSTVLRVPKALRIQLEPVGEAREFSPVGLRLEALLIDQSTGRSIVDPWFAGAFEGPHVGDWRYIVTELTLTGVDITAATLTAIRLPALLRRALAGVVLFVKDGGFSLDPQDFDERAVAAYVRAQLVGENPTTAVAQELGVSPNAAGQRVYRLRKAGRLPAAAKKGKS